MPKRIWRILYFGLLVLLTSLLVSGCGEQKKSTVQESTEDITAGFIAARDYVAVTKEQTRVYRTPDTAGEVYTVLEPGVNLRRTGYKGDWTRIRLNETALYVETSRVEKTEVEWAPEKEEVKNNHIVFIDPAKQIYANSEKEPIYPVYGEETAPMKPKMTRGAVGVVSGTFEYEITLSVAEKLKHELELRGYTVILSRAGSTVTMSNSERAIAGNQSEAEIMIRLSAQGSENSETKGVMSFIEASLTEDISEHYQNCFYLANSLLTEMCAVTEATRLGVFQTDQMTFLNYAKKPAAVIQLGFLTNAEEDRKLSGDVYQSQLARGLANGIDEYFKYIDGKKAEQNEGGNDE